VNYSTEIEPAMRSFYDSLSERDRRRSAALEAAQRGHGGVASITAVLGSDPKTIRPGQDDLGHLPDDLGQRVRKKGGDASGAERLGRLGRRTSCGCSRTTPQATRCVRTGSGPS
jgi:hypothetical protein